MSPDQPLGGRLTFVDSNVLIAAARGNEEISQAALQVLDDPDRRFAASEFLRLEVLPKPVYHGRAIEADFYATFFLACKEWADDLPAMTAAALVEAQACGLSAMDALHVAAAEQLGAEIVTAERRTSPIFRTSQVTVATIR